MYENAIVILFFVLFNILFSLLHMVRNIQLYESELYIYTHTRFFNFIISAAFCFYFKEKRQQILIICKLEHIFKLALCCCFAFKNNNKTCSRVQCKRLLTARISWQVYFNALH